MDFNIAAALYVAAKGEGVLYDGTEADHADSKDGEHRLLRYATDAPREELPDRRADGGTCQTCGKAAKARFNFASYLVMIYLSWHPYLSVFHNKERS